MKNELITKAEADKLRKKNAPIVARADKMIISTIAHEEKATTELKVIKDGLKFIEDRRTAITKPLNQSIKAANNMFKEIAQPLKDADAVIRKKIMDFREKQAEIARKEEEKRAKIRESHKKKGHKVHAPVFIEPVVSSTTVTQKRWTFDVEDISKVPIEYLVVDSAAVRESIIDGVREISGLRIYQKESLSIR